MRRHRTTGVLLVLAGLVAATSTTPASGNPAGGVPRLVFPLVAKTDLWDNYGDPRPNGRHAGIDMENRTQILSSFTADSREAMVAFLEKRPANFEGK